jgi:hypothetical protein
MEITRARHVAPPPLDSSGGDVRVLSLSFRFMLWARNMLFRFAVVALLVGSFLVVRHAKAAFWPTGGHAAHNLFDHVVQWGAIVWSLILPWAVADVAGWLIYRRHTPVTVEASRSPGLSRRMPHPVAFRIVTRGDQPSTAIATTWSVLEAMQSRPLFRFRVEVVSDTPIEGFRITQRCIRSSCPRTTRR